MTRTITKVEGALTYGMQRKINVSPEQMSLAKSLIFPGSTDDELRLFLYECERRGVHPLDRMIFPIKRNVTTDRDAGTKEARITFQCSIDYFRSESENAGDYAGMDDPTFGTEAPDGFPEWAKVTVWRYIARPDGELERVAFTGTARWREYYPGEKLGFMWRKMPYLMLAKCAEALARRMAWPQKFARLYTDDEMAQAELVQAPRASISDSVKPTRGLPTPQANPSTAGKGQPKPQDELADELRRRCPRSLKDQQDLLKSVSNFVTKEGEKWATDPAKMTPAWARKALERLRAIPMPGAGTTTDGEPADCTQDPRLCAHSAFFKDEEEGDGVFVALCGPAGEKRCPYQAGEE